MTTFVFKIKCQGCGLHYEVCSWDEGWGKAHEYGFCPECGVKGGKMVWGPQKLDRQIFQLVPGDTPLSFMG